MPTSNLVAQWDSPMIGMHCGIPHQLELTLRIMREPQARLSDCRFSPT